MFVSHTQQTGGRVFYGEYYVLMLYFFPFFTIIGELRGQIRTGKRCVVQPLFSHFSTVLRDMQCARYAQIESFLFGKLFESNRPTKRKFTISELAIRCAQFLCHWKIMRTKRMAVKFVLRWVKSFDCVRKKKIRQCI